MPLWVSLRSIFANYDFIPSIKRASICRKEPQFETGDLLYKIINCRSSYSVAHFALQLTILNDKSAVSKKVSFDQTAL